MCIVHTAWFMLKTVHHIFIDKMDERQMLKTKCNIRTYTRRLWTVHAVTLYEYMNCKMHNFRFGFVFSTLLFYVHFVLTVCWMIMFQINTFAGVALDWMGSKCVCMYIVHCISFKIALTTINQRILCIGRLFQAIFKRDETEYLRSSWNFLYVLAEYLKHNIPLVTLFNILSIQKFSAHSVTIFVFSPSYPFLAFEMQTYNVHWIHTWVWMCANG